MRLQIYFIPTVCWGVVSVLIKKMFAWPRTSVFSMLCERHNFGFGLNFIQVCKETSDLQGRSLGKNIPIFFVLYNKIRRVQYPCLYCFSYFVSYHMRQKKGHKEPNLRQNNDKKGLRNNTVTNQKTFLTGIMKSFQFSTWRFVACIKHSILVQFCPKNEHYPFKELLKVCLLSTMTRSLEIQRCIIRMCL